MIDDQTLERVVAFHGHMCPGLAMGVRAAQVALAEIGPHSADEEVVAVVETDMCAVDAVQVLTGCTFGKGNLVHRDYGKNAYTFIRRSDGRAIRISTRAGGWGQADPERDELLPKIRAGVATDEERARFWALQRQKSEDILASPAEDIYDIRELKVEPPRRARIHISVECASCREPTMETRVRFLEGQQLCTPCFELALAGTTRVELSATPTAVAR